MIYDMWYSIFYMIFYINPQYDITILCYYIILYHTISYYIILYHTISYYILLYIIMYHDKWVFWGQDSPAAGHRYDRTAGPRGQLAAHLACAQFLFLGGAICGAGRCLGALPFGTTQDSQRWFVNRYGLEFDLQKRRKKSMGIKHGNWKSPISTGRHAQSLDFDYRFDYMWLPKESLWDLKLPSPLSELHGYAERIWNDSLNMAFGGHLRCQKQSALVPE